MSSRNAKRIKNIHGMEQIMIDLKPNRCDIFVYSHIDFDVTELVKRLDTPRKTLYLSMAQEAEEKDETD